MSVTDGSRSNTEQLCSKKTPMLSSRSTNDVPTHRQTPSRDRQRKRRQQGKHDRGKKKNMRQWHLTRNPQQQHLPAASLVSHSSGLVARLIQHSIKLLRTSGPVADLCQTNAVWKASARLCLQQRRRRLRRVADEMCMYSHCRSLLEGSLLDTRHRPVRKESDIACFAFPLLLS